MSSAETRRLGRQYGRPARPPEVPTTRGTDRFRGARQRLWPLMLPIAALAAYHNSFTVPFLFDDISIVDTRTLHEPWSLQLLTGTTRPLVQLTLALNYAAGGLHVAGYHAVNLAIHVLAALVLFGVVARTFGTERLRADWQDAAPSVALAVSLVWTVHPLQTESVTYVVQRAESLMALCYLLVLYGVIRGAASPHPKRWYAAAVAACALGMLSKPVMVTAPLAALLYDRVFLAGSWRGAWRERRGLHAGLAATWILLLVLLTGQNESAATAGFAMRHLTVLDYARSQPGVILRYLRLAFWPSGLVLDYGWPIANETTDVVLPALVLAGIVAATLWAFRRRPELGFLGVMFFLVLAPSSSVIPIQDLAFEHRMYLPLAALVVLTVSGARLLIRRAGLGVRAARQLGFGTTAVLVAALTVLTVARNRDYRSAVAMWTDVAVKRPQNPRAHGNLGQALNQDDRTDEAIVSLRRALQLDPSYVAAHTNLGRALAARGQYQEAESHYAEALRLDPGHAQAHNNWGVALVDQDRAAEAQAHYEAALRLEPEYAKAQNNLGVALMRQGRAEEAKTRYAEALRLEPDYAEAYSNLGNVLAREGKSAEAVHHYERALHIDPTAAEIHFNLALVLATEGKRDQATAHVAEALRLRPDLEALYRKSGLLAAR